MSKDQPERAAGDRQQDVLDQQLAQQPGPAGPDGQTDPDLAPSRQCARQHQGRFPKSVREVPKAVVDHLAQQLDMTPAIWREYDWQGRAIKYHRAEIRKLLGFREATVADGEALVNWLCDQCLPHTRRFEHIESAAYDRLRTLQLEPPTSDRLERLLRSALAAFDQRFCEAVHRRLSSATHTLLEALLLPVD